MGPSINTREQPEATLTGSTGDGREPKGIRGDLHAWKIPEQGRTAKSRGGQTPWETQGDGSGRAQVKETKVEGRTAREPQKTTTEMGNTSGCESPVTR